MDTTPTTLPSVSKSMTDWSISLPRLIGGWVAWEAARTTSFIRVVEATDEVVVVNSTTGYLSVVCTRTAAPRTGVVSRSINNITSEICIRCWNRDAIYGFWGRKIFPAPITNSGAEDAGGVAIRISEIYSP
jgi:hypothetical protein